MSGQPIADLQLAFDQSFAEGRSAAPPALEYLLAVRIGGDPYALRLSEIGGLHVDRKVVTVPSAAGALSGFLGIVAIRGTLVPVYDLRPFLGYGEGPVPRWLVLAHGPAVVGLAFDLFEAHLRATPEQVPRPEAGNQLRQYVRGVAIVDGFPRPLIHVGSIVETIARRNPQAPQVAP